MTIVEDFQTGVEEALAFGQQVRFKYYDISFGAGSYYDDDVGLSTTGSDIYVSGVILPISSIRGSSDAVLIDQGKILMNDSKLYIEGTVNTSGTFKVGLGSPISGSEYSMISQGVTKWDVNATSILKKLYIRQLPNGSLTGE